MKLHVEEVEATSHERWNNFLSAAFTGTYCHRFEWKSIIESAYHLPVLMLAISNEGQWIGTFPVVVMPTPFGKRQKGVSVAFCGYGGLACNSMTDSLYTDSMLAAVLGYLKKRGIGEVEVRELQGARVDAGTVSEVSLFLKLPADEAVLWRTVGDKVRSQIRKAQKMGLTVRWGREQVGELYDVYAANMVRLGTPVHARAFFEAIVRGFGEDADILTVRLADKAIGAMLLLKHGGTWADPFASSLPGYQRYNPNMLLYWEALRNACIHGAESFDFGRSRVGSGTEKFKRQWGAVPCALEYRTYVDGKQSNVASTSFYRGSKGRLVSSIWRKLPSPIQMAIGPKIRKWLP